MNFSERLNILIRNNNLSKAKLSREIGIATSRLSNFCNGIDMPSLKNALKLVNFFKCSFDFLFGLTDDLHTINEERTYNKQIFLKRINIMLDINQLSIRSLCSKIGLNNSSVWSWKKSDLPKPESLIKIATFFNCTIDYLLGY